MMSCLTKNLYQYFPVPRTTTRFYHSKLGNSSKEIISSKMMATLNFLGKIFRRQANVYVNNRIRRANQLYNKYQKTFFSKFFQNSSVVQNFVRKATKRKSQLMLSAAAAFSFRKEGIPDSEIQRCVDEFWLLKEKGQECECGAKENSNVLKIENFADHLKTEGYECIVSSESLHIWRKSEPELDNYKYKIFGTFTDIPAKAFFDVQCDIEYRKKWDKLVVELNVVDKNPRNEVIYWQMRYPFPMNCRDYVFVRRNLIDDDSGCLIVVSHATTHPNCPPRKRIVRVDQYMSDMVISPHGSADENGFDYLLTYYDEPHSSFPSTVYSWMATSGVHDYLKRLHQATKELNGTSQPSSCQTVPKNATNVVQHSPVPIGQYA